MKIFAKLNQYKNSQNKKSVLSFFLKKVFYKSWVDLEYILFDEKRVFRKENDCFTDSCNQFKPGIRIIK